MDSFDVMCRLPGATALTHCLHPGLAYAAAYTIVGQNDLLPFKADTNAIPVVYLLRNDGAPTRKLRNHLFIRVFIIIDLCATLSDLCAPQGGHFRRLTGDAQVEVALTSEHQKHPLTAYPLFYILISDLTPSLDFNPLESQCSDQSKSDYYYG